MAPVFNGTKPGAVIFTVTNDGNVPATKISSVQFLASIDGSLADASSIVTIPLNFSLKPGQSRVFKGGISIKVPLSPATYELLALLDPAGIYGTASINTDLAVPDNLLVSVDTFTIDATP